jgi:hypothetical protein
MTATFGSTDQDTEVLFDLRLTDVVIKGAWTQHSIRELVIAGNTWGNGGNA